MCLYRRCFYFSSILCNRRWLSIGRHKHCIIYFQFNWVSRYVTTVSIFPCPSSKEKIHNSRAFYAAHDAGPAYNVAERRRLYDDVVSWVACHWYGELNSAWDASRNVWALFFSLRAHLIPIQGLGRCTREINLQSRIDWLRSLIRNESQLHNEVELPFIQWLGAFFCSIVRLQN